MPFGPREDFTASATILAAKIFACWASLPRERLEPSFRISMGVPANPTDKFQQPPPLISFHKRKTASQYKFFWKNYGELKIYRRETLIGDSKR
jgi:hypothetical protein